MVEKEVFRVGDRVVLDGERIAQILGGGEVVEAKGTPLTVVRLEWASVKCICRRWPHSDECKRQFNQQWGSKLVVLASHGGEILTDVSGNPRKISVDWLKKVEGETRNVSQ